jgi:hypothetical protein
VETNTIYKTSLYGKGKIDETLANFMKQNTQQRRKRRNKERGHDWKKRFRGKKS